MTVWCFCSFYRELKGRRASNQKMYPAQQTDPLHIPDIFLVLRLAYILGFGSLMLRNVAYHFWFCFSFCYIHFEQLLWAYFFSLFIVITDEIG
jgi:hypothetical protein